MANFGEGNSLWPQCRAKGVLATIDDELVHPFWQARDRDGYVAAAMAGAVTVLGLPPSKPTAGRWYNLIEELEDSEGDLWVSRQGDALWWTISERGPLMETLQDSDRPERHGPRVWVLEKPCQAWSDRDGAGRPLRWSALHPKARDFLATEATFQALGDDRGYADYTRALVAGGPLDAWHALPLFSDKAAQARRNPGRIFSSKELAAERMTRTLLETVAGANGQVVERRLKEKTTSLSRIEWEALLRQKMGEQQDRCALTGLPLGYDQECDDREMLVSLDRIDSAGHYTPDNVQLVCRFINRWKKADDDQLTRRLLAVLADAARAPAPGQGGSG